MDNAHDYITDWQRHRNVIFLGLAALFLIGVVGLLSLAISVVCATGKGMIYCFGLLQINFLACSLSFLFAIIFISLYERLRMYSVLVYHPSQLNCTITCHVYDDADNINADELVWGSVALLLATGFLGVCVVCTNVSSEPYSLLENLNCKLILGALVSLCAHVCKIHAVKTLTGNKTNNRLTMAGDVLVHPYIVFALNKSV